jgi:molybdate-binding protein
MGMCTGKYDKNGWTFIFKANSIKEAEDFIDNNSRVINRKRCSILERNMHIQDFDTVQIPAFI